MSNHAVIPPISKLVLCSDSSVFDLEEHLPRSCIKINNQKCRTKAIFDGWVLPKVAIKCFLLTVHPVMQQHMVCREEKSPPLPAFCLQPCFVLLTHAVLPRFQMVSWELAVSGNAGCNYLTLVKKSNCSKGMVLAEYTGVKGALEECETLHGAWRKGDAGECAKT